MLIETFPQGVRMIEGTPNIVVSILPDKEVVVQIVGVDLEHGYWACRNLASGQDPLPVLQRMFGALLKHLAAPPAQQG